LYSTLQELACPSPPSNLYNVYRSYRATLLNGPGGTPIAAPTDITVTIPTSGDFGNYNLVITIYTGTTLAEQGLYTRVYPDCEDRALIQIQTVDLNGTTISPTTFTVCLEV
jgi:hypothetical protein